MNQMQESRKSLINEYIKKNLTQNISEIAGKSIPVTVLNTDFENFKTASDKINEGRILLVYTDTDHALMSLLLPNETRKTLFDKIINSEQNKDSSITAVLNRIAGNLPYLCSVKENTSVFTLQKPYKQEFKDQLLWDVSECNIYQCSVSGADFYLMLNIELQNMIEKLLDSDPDYKKNLLERINSKDISENGICSVKEADIKLRIKNPHEFIAGRNFLPSEAFLGKKDVSVVFRQIIASEKPVSKINKEIIWYRFSITKEGVEYPVYYSADVKSREKKYLQLFNTLFTELVKKTAVFLRSQTGFERVNGKIISHPLLDDVKDAVILTSAIKWENKRIKTQVFVPSFFLSDYLSAYLEEWEVDSLKNNKKSVLLNLLSINSTLFGKNINTLYQPSGQESSKNESSLISVSKIMAILDNYTAGRLVQNYFLAGGSSLDDFQSLFLYRYSAEGEETEKTGQDPLFNKEDYKKYIPKALHSDWDLCSAASSGNDDMLERNEQALKGIYKAIQEDQLLMPYKVFFILYNVFQKPMDERYKQEITKLVEESNWLNLIEMIPKKTGQQVISSTPTSLLGTALVSEALAVKDIAHLMSKKKQSELEEEISVKSKKYESGSLSSESVFNALEELVDILNQLAIPEDEMV